MLVMNHIVVTDKDGEEDIAIAGTANVLTKAYMLRAGYSFALWMKLTTGTGTVDMSITTQQSYKLPTTEGSADADWVAPAANSAIVTNRTSETAYIGTISPVTAPYIRFLIDGQNSNNAAATIKLVLIVQQDI